MTLNINESISDLAASGSRGATGADGTVLAPVGARGLDGGDGTDAAVSLFGQTYQGDAGADHVDLTVRARGGVGGSGGWGGKGSATPVDIRTVEDTDTRKTVETTYGQTGPGGDAGRGGDGGDGDTAVEDLDFVLGAGGNTLSLLVEAGGGTAGEGGWGGDGGSVPARSTKVEETYDSAGRLTFTETTRALADSGGAAGAGAMGGSAGSAEALAQGITISGQLASASIKVIAVTGQAGQGGRGGEGGDGGASGGAPGLGADGGDRGGAEALLTGLSVDATAGASVLAILVRARVSDDSGGGGAGGAGGAGRQIDQYDRVKNGSADLLPGSYRTDETTYVGSANGANGGDGADATAVFSDSLLRFGAGADTLTISLNAEGASGGRGGGGGRGNASSLTVDPDGYEQVRVNGNPAGRDGNDGSDGTTAGTLRDLDIDFGGGDDRMNLEITVQGGAAAKLSVRGVALKGGDGLDTIAFAHSSDPFTTGLAPAVTVKVHLGTFGYVGAGPASRNTIAGFERFLGTQNGDRFVDGVGDQFYAGGRGDDTYVFSRNKGGGHDTVADFGENRIEIKGYGLNSLAAVLAATADTANGALIALDAASSILLPNYAKADLTDALFGF